MRIITLIENTKSDLKSLINEHGLSLYIERRNKRILFDTGRTGNFINNAKKLEINLEQVDLVVLSHGHYDHGGGLLPFFRVNVKAKVYMKKEASGNYYFHTSIFNKNIGLDKKIFEQYPDRIYYIDSFTEIMEDVFIITKINNHTLNTKGNKFLFSKRKNKIVKDVFDHELIMVIKDNDGLCIFTGCSHNRTVSLIQATKNEFPGVNIKSLIGGFHLIGIPLINLLSASRDEINAIAEEIIGENIEKVYTGHCTGKKAYKELKSILGDRINYIKTGTDIYI